MSRENANSGNRCSNCGGRMRLVNVTWVNRFPTSLAGLNGSSVSRHKNPPQSTAQEMMCTCCSQRTPMADRKVTKAKKAPKEKVKKAKVQENVKRERAESEAKSPKKHRRVRIKGIVRFIKFLIFLAVVAAIVYFGYLYKDTLIGYWEPLSAVYKKIEELIAFVKGILKI